MKLTKPFVISILLILTLFIIGVVWGVPYFLADHQAEQSDGGFGSRVFKAEVTDILEQGETQLGDLTQTYQVVQARVLSGEYAGIPMTVEYGKYAQRPNAALLRVGDKIFVTIDVRPDGVVSAYFTDHDRSTSMWVLFGVFVLSILWLARWKGARALIALGFSFLLIVGYVIPHILAGEDPIQVSLIGSALLLVSTLYLTYGWNIKTHSSVVSILLALVVTGLLSVVFVNASKLSGFGDENAMFLVQISTSVINLRGLLLGGMIIGSLGVLDDLVTSQVASSFELFRADPSSSMGKIYKSVMSIGQDHVAATVNTLVLAYTGASLPLLLLFALGKSDISYLINVEFVSEEVVRALVGSIGLIAAVPISSFISAYAAKNANRMGHWYALLGGLGKDESFHHHG